MPLVCDRAICLRRHEWSETSQILTLLTARHGLIRVVARGAHRTTKAGASKFDGGIDLLDEGDALFTDRVDKDLNTLAEWKLVDGHRGLRGGLRPLHLSLYLAEVVGALFEAQDPHPSVFARLRWTLHRLPTPAIEEAGVAMVLDALLEAGLAPELAVCVRCQRSVAHDRAAYLSAEQGGVVCRRCERGVPDRIAVDPRAISLASHVARLPRNDDGSIDGQPRLTRRDVDPIHTILARHAEYNVGHGLRLARRIVGRGAIAPARVASRVDLVDPDDLPTVPLHATA